MTETEQPQQPQHAEGTGSKNGPALTESELVDARAALKSSLLKVRLVRGKPVTDVDALRKYHREYYHRSKQESECEHCSRKFSSDSALVRHQRSAQKCLLLRAKAELELLRHAEGILKQ